MKMATPVVGYAIDVDDFNKLRKLSDTLHSGNDKERDLGHKIWLILNVVELNAIKMETS
jgi:hypothetical protein